MFRKIQMRILFSNPFMLYYFRKRGMLQPQFFEKSFGRKNGRWKNLSITGRIWTSTLWYLFFMWLNSAKIDCSRYLVVVNIQTSFSTVKAFFLLLFPTNSNMLGWLDIDKKCNAIIESCKLAKALKYLSSFSYFLCKIRVNFHFIFCKTQPSLAIW